MPLVDDIARSVAFLSRIPVPDRFFDGYDGSLTRATRAFPLAGLVIAAAPALLLLILGLFEAPPALAAILVLGLATLITGGLHDDGLADTADGVGGGRDRAAALSIMRDSRIGTYGALALVLSIAVRAAALAALVSALPPIAAALCVLAAGAMSRAVIVWHWALLPAARSDGVAVSAGRPGPVSLATALAIGAASGFGFLCWATGFGAAISAIAATGLAGWAITRYIRSRLGGHTGDTIGASQQCAEMAALVALALCA